MALKKSYEHPSGREGEYWKVTKAEIDFVKKSVVGVISCYIDKAAREAGKSPITSKPFYVELEDVTEDVRPEVYEKLKETMQLRNYVVVEEENEEGEMVEVRKPFFYDAVDC